MLRIVGREDEEYDEVDHRIHKYPKHTFASPNRQLLEKRIEIASTRCGCRLVRTDHKRQPDDEDTDVQQESGLAAWRRQVKPAQEVAHPTEEQANT